MHVKSNVKILQVKNPTHAKLGEEAMPTLFDERMAYPFHISLFPLPAADHDGDHAHGRRGRHQQGKQGKQVALLVFATAFLPVTTARLSCFVF